MIKNFLMFVLIGILMVGCTGPTTVVRTATVPPLVETAAAAPTGEPVIATNANTPTAEANVAPTAKPLPTMVVEPSSPYSLNENGFSFTSVKGMTVQIRPPQAILSTLDQQAFFSLTSDELKQENDLKLLFNDFVGSIQQSIPDLQATDPAPITVGGMEGLSTKITGTMNGGPFRGQVVLVVVDDKRVFYASGIGMVENAGDQWQAQGQPAFASVLDSVAFFEPKTGGDLCAVSADPTYGTTTENPIKVGGDWTEGPYRERAFMDLLRGPNGEEITYERVRSEQVGDIILDVYEINGLAEKVTLYLDMYNFDVLEIPAGFTCSGPIPLGAPKK